METGLDGLFVISRPVHRDNRGTFSRLYGLADLAGLGLMMECVQVNHSVSELAGTMRGMHFQYPPHAERKLVACATGAIVDVAVDLRPDSPSFLASFQTELRGDDGRSVLVPEGFAHGFITMEPATHVVYVSSESHSPQNEDGIRYDDAALQILWPAEPTVLSDKDNGWPPLEGRLEALIARLAVGEEP